MTQLPLAADLLLMLMDDFYQTALGKAAEKIRFIIIPLDPAYYQVCMEILSNRTTSPSFPWVNRTISSACHP